MTDSRKPSTAGPKEKPYVPIEHRPLLGVSEAAALTGLDEKIVRQAIRQGELIACYAPYLALGVADTRDGWVCLSGIKPD